ncbi:MAG TPA: 1-deoxy-D-xylulose-5-phosphate reductoisomerase [Elusimicrobiota bacterium]|nr:1-deoxy-D-xylulose-5-phosphate reductoisomerase [Elusimicrobiota bacterium]
MKRIALLGSTGSIGVNALDVIRRLNRSSGSRHPLTAPYRVQALSAQKNLDRILKQIAEFRPADVVMGDPSSAARVTSWARQKRIPVRVSSGAEGLKRIAAGASVDMLLSSVVGFAGLAPLVAAVRAGKTVALANKEALIVAGGLVMKEAARSGARVIPVDSEHSAIFQCLGPEKGRRDDARGAVIRRILLTASGGPFYRRAGSLSSVSVREALAHPTWKMGNKITVDSATLMNKGLEAIEAHHLFGVPMEKIHIIIHPQSIVHSMVEFEDGSVLAQMSRPDMRLPIQYALTYPERRDCPVRPLDLEHIGRLDFASPDFRRFPCLQLALTAGRRGGTLPTVLNAANEVAVDLFLSEAIGFMDIPRLIGTVMRKHRGTATPSLDRIFETDHWARKTARTCAEHMRRNHRCLS